MEMKKINSGKLRAIGYDARVRMLQVQLDDGSSLQYSGVGEDIWRRLSSSGAAWSFYRDNIEDEFTAKRISGNGHSEARSPHLNPLDETTSHSTKLQNTAAKSLVIPLAGRAQRGGRSQANESLREILDSAPAGKNPLDDLFGKTEP